MVYKIIEGMKGKIMVNSQLGKGTEVVLKLPAGSEWKQCSRAKAMDVLFM